MPVNNPFRKNEDKNAIYIPNVKKESSSSPSPTAVNRYSEVVLSNKYLQDEEVNSQSPEQSPEPRASDFQKL